MSPRSPTASTTIRTDRSARSNPRRSVDVGDKTSEYDIAATVPHSDPPTAFDEPRDPSRTVIESDAPDPVDASAFVARFR